MNDLSYLHTEYAREKMIEEFNKPYKEKKMASYTTQANSYDNIFIHKVLAEAFTALVKLTGAEVKGDLEKYLSFKIGNVQVTAFQKEEGDG